MPQFLNEIIETQDTEFRQPDIPTPPSPGPDGADAPGGDPPPAAYRPEGITEDPLGEKPTVPSQSIQDVDPVFTAEGLTMMIDTLQQMGFTVGQQRKLRKKFFQNREEFLKARKIKYEPDRELEKKDDGGELIGLKKRYQDYIKVLDEKTRDIPWNDEEEMMVRRPLEKLSSRYNFDLPPGAAFFAAMVAVSLPRFVDLLTD